MIPVIGSPEALAILKRDRAIAQGEREAEQLAAEPLHRFEVTTISQVYETYRVMARDSSEAKALCRNGDADRIAEERDPIESYETRDLGEVTA